MMAEILDFVKDFQTGIVGGIGFLGVIFTQRANAKSLQVQADQDFRRKQNSVRTAVLAELKMFRRSFETNSGGDMTENDEIAYVPRVRRILSEKLLPDLGVLPDDTLEVVLNGLVIIDEVDRTLMLFSNDITEQHFSFDSQQMILCENIFKGAIPSIDLAITALDKVPTS